MKEPDGKSAPLGVDEPVAVEIGANVGTEPFKLDPIGLLTFEETAEPG